MVNGRISSRSYPRYKLVRPFFKKVLADVDRFCMQSEESARRLVDIGAEPARVSVTGSLKFDSLDMPGTATPGRGRDRVLRYFRLTSNRAVIVFGSHMQNFKEIAEAFLSHDAAIQVSSVHALEDALLALLTDPVRRARLGAAARALVESNRGAKDKSLAVIGQLLPLRDGSMAIV